MKTNNGRNKPASIEKEKKNYVISIQKAQINTIPFQYKFSQVEVEGILTDANRLTHGTDKQTDIEKEKLKKIHL